MAFIVAVIFANVFIELLMQFFFTVYLQKLIVICF